MNKLNLKDTILEAEKNKTAIGHFNISNLEALWGIFEAARELKVPVVIGLSEGERKFVGVKTAVALVKNLREEFDYPIFINADHSYSFESVKEVVDAGFDAVIFDGAQLPIEENIAITKKCVDYAKSVNPDILVEAEMGYIGTSSKMLEDIPEGVDVDSLTTPEEAKKFVEETGIDLFSPSVGNIHGMLKKTKNPELNIKRIKEIREFAGVPLVLHGGSGITDDNFSEAIKAGISTIHINTEIRKAYKQALDESLKDNPEEIAPYRILKSSREAVKEVVKKRLKLFSNI